MQIFGQTVFQIEKRKSKEVLRPEHPGCVEKRASSVGEGERDVIREKPRSWIP